MSAPDQSTAAAVAPVPPTASLLLRLVAGNAVVIALVLGLAVFMLFESRQEYRQHAEVATGNLARVLGQNIAAVIDKADVSLRTVTIEMERQAARGGIDAQALGTFLAHQRGLLPELASLRIADAAGDIRFGFGPVSPKTVSVADRDYFLRARDDPRATLVISGPVKSRITDKWAIVLARRLQGPDGRFAGVVFASIGREYFQSLFAAMILGPQGSITLRTADSRLVARFPVTSWLDEAMGKSDNAGPELMAAVADKPDGATYVATNPVDQIERTLTHARIGPHPLYIVVGFASDDYLADWRKEVIKVSAWAFLVILAALGSSWLVYQGGLRQRRADEALARESRRSQTLLRTGSDGICVVSSEGRLLEVNGAFCRHLGYSREELIGLHIDRIDAALSPEEIADVGRQAFAGQYLFETRHRRRNGTTVAVEVSAVGIEIDGESVVFSATRDISGRKQAEAEQQRLKRTLELVNSSNTLLLHAEDEGRLLEDICHLIVERGGYLMAWVGTAEADAAQTVRPVAVSGYEEGYLDGPRISWADTELGGCPTGAAIRTGRTQINPDVLTNPAMAPWREAALKRGFRSSIGLPLVDQGKVLGALTIYGVEPEMFSPEEIGLLESLANNLAFGMAGLRARSLLASANRELQGFTYAVSHDLKAPLGRISSFTTLLERRYRDRLDGEGLQFLDFIRDNALRLTTLVDDLLDHAQVEQHTLHLEAVPLRAVVREVLQEGAAAIREIGAEVRVDLPELQVWANPSGLAVALRNLLENALKYSAQATPPTIEIGGQAVDGRCRLWVRDNGIGFDMVYHDRIFEIFRRLHTYKEYPGSGIGLALVKKAMERMGGRIWAESAPGAGACFYLELAM